jgi:hypothetical protein
MFFWFLGTAVVSVWFVFRDEKFDYRTLMVGALLPDIIDIPAGGVWVFHSVTASVVVLVAVMAIWRRGSFRRRSLLGVPIGMFFHLVFDGAFANTESFWWPFTGVTMDSASVPSLERGLFNVLLEVAGLAMLAWVWRRAALEQPEHRRLFISSGVLYDRIDRSANMQEPPTC